MSQSDYLKRKQIANRLRIDGGDTENKQPAVFSSHDLLLYKQYQLINDDPSIELNTNLIIPSTKKNVFGIERDVTRCPTFIVCQDTNTRPNRELRVVADCYTKIHPLNWEQKKNVKSRNTLCKCQLKRRHINRNVCSCDIKSE